MQRLTSLDLPRLPLRPLDAHKGSAGRVLAAAGSYGMAGAAYLTAAGAYGAGAGYVRVACPAVVYPIVASKALCAVFIPLECDAHNQVVPAEAVKVLEAAAVSDAAVIGPGIGETPAARDFFRRLLEGLDIPAVVDASGLSILSQWKEGLGRLPKGSVLTPHPGEMARLVGGSAGDILGDREAAVAVLAKQAGAVIVLKGARTLVCDGARLYENTSGNSGMACAGTGDVLAGAVASLIAEGLASFEAACLGVYLHGKAGDIAAQTRGRALTAEDVAAHLPRALMLWERGRFERGRRGGDCR